MTYTQYQLNNCTHPWYTNENYFSWLSASCWHMRVFGWSLCCLLAESSLIAVAKTIAARTNFFAYKLAHLYAMPRTHQTKL